VISAVPREATEALERLRALDAELGPRGVDVELCLVGGVVMSLVFQRTPASRRPRALFGFRSALEDAEHAVGQRLGLGAGWVEEAARRVAGGSGSIAPVYEGGALRVLAAPAEYVLSFKCAALEFCPAAAEITDIEADIRYLMRYLNLREPSEVLQVISRFINERQRPADLADRLARMLGS